MLSFGEKFKKEKVRKRENKDVFYQNALILRRKPNNNNNKNTSFKT